MKKLDYPNSIPPSVIFIFTTTMSRPKVMKRNVRVRTAQPGDLETLRRFEQGLIAAERPMDPLIKSGDIHYYDLNAMMASPDIELVVAELDRNLIASGYARIERSRHYLRHTVHAYIGFMYVEPAYRGKGVNQLIIDALKAWALSRRITELRLDVYLTSSNAIRAYEKAGFTPYLVNLRMGI